MSSTQNSAQLGPGSCSVAVRGSVAATAAYVPGFIGAEVRRLPSRDVETLEFS